MRKNKNSNFRKKSKFSPKIFRQNFQEVYHFLSYFKGANSPKTSKNENFRENWAILKKSYGVWLRKNGFWEKIKIQIFEKIEIFAKNFSSKFSTSL